jgi:hypothetical protein
MNKRQRKKEKKKAVEARLKELRIEVVRTPSASHRRRGIEIRPTNHDRPPSVPALEAFIREHEYCGELASVVEVDRVWITCTSGAVVSRTLEPA